MEQFNTTWEQHCENCEEGKETKNQNKTKQNCRQTYTANTTTMKTKKMKLLNTKTS